ncbi:fibronectin [Bacillus thuringiensis serovar kim]|nr:fibronectin [Bacillus thuringiensis serovar kim]
MPTDIHLPPKIGVSHLHTFEEGVFCRKTIKVKKPPLSAYKSGLVCCK